VTQQVKTNDKLLNETKKYVFFENKNNNVLLSVFLKNPSCFSLMKRTPSFSNLCDGWAANPVTSLLLKRIWVDAFTVWNEKKMKQWINKEPIITCVSRIVVFIVKNFNTKILFPYLVGWLDSSTVKKLWHKCYNTAWLRHKTGMVTRNCFPVFALTVVWATIFGTLCIKLFLSSFSNFCC